MTPDPASPDIPENTSGPNFFQKITGALFHGSEQPQPDFLDALRQAKNAGLIADDSAQMIEGVLKVSELCASDIMVPMSQIRAIDISQPQEEWIRQANASGHSRFPVIDGDFSDVKGLLHAKDLLNALLNRDFQLSQHLREAKFVPETMPLNQLLKEFRLEHQHLALVVDEFGEVTGLLTLEDVLEQIVGSIDDEFDTVDAEAGNIVEDPKDRNRWRVQAITHLDQFNDFFGTAIDDPHLETIGGIVSDRLERVPKRGDCIETDGLKIRVLRAGSRQAKLLLVERLSEKTQEPDSAGNAA